MSERNLKEEISSLKQEIRRLRESLSDLTPPLATLLRRRGFRIYKKEPPEDLLLPEERFIDDYYRLLTKYSFRLFLRDVIKHQESFTPKEVTRYSTAEVTDEYIRHLLALELLNRVGDSYRLKRRPVKTFGPTLEWFLSEIFERDFGAEAVWGIKFKRTGVGGDYDLIAKVDGSILCMEVKSSPPKQIYANELSAFLDRVLDLLPEIAVFFMDTELRMKDKIIPMIEDELRKRNPRELSSFLHTPYRKPSLARRMEKELFQIENKIFIINAKDSIVNNLEKVLRWHFRGAL